MIAQHRQPQLNTRNDSAVRFLGQPTALRATADTTGGAFGLVEQWAIPPGFGSPYHTHRREDEAFYILEGEIAFVTDGTWMYAGPGTYVFGPREVPHGFVVIGDAPARMLLLCAPGGFEQFVAALCTPFDAAPAPPDMAAMMAAAARFGIDIHGPLPDLPSELGTGRSRDRATIDRVRQDHVAAMNAHDAAAVAAVFAEDGVQMPPNAPVNAGRPAIETWMRGLFQAFRPRFAIVPAELRIAGDQAIEHGAYTLVLTPEAGQGARQESGKYITTYQRDGNGRWVTSRDMWSSDQPGPR